MSCHDVVSLDGKVHDPNRIDFLARYLDELKKAATVADIRGYFQWSLMDNFEWSKGYSERFGLIYIDYQTQQRILKDSATGTRYNKNNGESDSPLKKSASHTTPDMKCAFYKYVYYKY